MLRHRILSVFLLLWASFTQAAHEEYAVIRIPSHGASATVIETGPGYTWILGCAHAYEGGMRNKPMVFDIPVNVKRKERKVESHLVRINYQMDLSLVLLDDGPVDFVCFVAPKGWHGWGHHILSVGYDGMEIPAKVKDVHIMAEEGYGYFTREKPWHGRSGGGLIDIDAGKLVGVVQGYEDGPPPYTRGIYVNLNTIRRFLWNEPNPAKPWEAFPPINQNSPLPRFQPG